MARCASADGSDEFAVRPVTPADETALRLMYRRCTPLTRYHRFLSVGPDIPEAHLCAALSRKAGTDALLVAPVVAPGQAIALGSTHPYSPGVAELGLLVEDTWQRNGLGRLLLHRLAERCVQQGVAALTAQTLCGRRTLLSAVLAEGAGPAEYGPLSDTVRITVPLAAKSLTDARP